MYDGTIQYIDNCLRKRCPAYYSNLRPSLSSAEIVTFEQLLGVRLPYPFKAFYQWHDGEGRAVDSGFLLSRWSWMPSADVVRTVQTSRRDLAAGEYAAPNWWGKNWIPFLKNYAGDHVCLDLDGAFVGEPGQVIEFYHDDPSRTIVVPSFAQWLETLAGVMVEDKYLPSDQDSFNQTYTNFMEYILEHTSDYPIYEQAG